MTAAQPSETQLWKKLMSCLRCGRGAEGVGRWRGGKAGCINTVALKSCAHSVNLYFVITLLMFSAPRNKGRYCEWSVWLVILLGWPLTSYAPPAPKTQRQSIERLCSSIIQHQSNHRPSNHLHLSSIHPIIHLISFNIFVTIIHLSIQPFIIQHLSDIIHPTLLHLASIYPVIVHHPSSVRLTPSIHSVIDPSIYLSIQTLISNFKYWKEK